MVSDLLTFDLVWFQCGSHCHAGGQTRAEGAMDGPAPPPILRFRHRGPAVPLQPESWSCSLCGKPSQDRQWSTSESFGSASMGRQSSRLSLVRALSLPPTTLSLRFLRVLTHFCLPQELWLV